MSMENRLSDYLDHMRQAAMKVCAYGEGKRREEFLADEWDQDAVVRNIGIIGEAATQIMKMYPEFIKRHPEFDWLGIRSMRNRVIHDYFAINYEVVWDVMRNDLPELLAQLAAIQAEE